MNCAIHKYHIPFLIWLKRCPGWNISFLLSRPGFDKILEGKTFSIFSLALSLIKEYSTKCFLQGRLASDLWTLRASLRQSLVLCPPQSTIVQVRLALIPKIFLHPYNFTSPKILARPHTPHINISMCISYNNNNRSSSDLTIQEGLNV